MYAFACIAPLFIEDLQPRIKGDVKVYGIVTSADAVTALRYVLGTAILVKDDLRYARLMLFR